MTYLYYKSTTSTTEPKISEKTIAEWKHLATKKNWRITQLPNGYYQTEVNDSNNEERWVDVTRRETIEGMGSRGGEANRKAVLLEQLEIDEKIFAIMQNTTVEADVMTQKFDELLKKITQEEEETARILELRREGLNPEIAKTIA